MSEAVTIRAFRPEEIDRVVEIALAAWEPIFASYRNLLGDELFNLTRPNWRVSKADDIRRACKDAANVLIAEVDGAIAGFATFYLISDEIGEIGNNAVDPKFQGRGIAGRLYAEAFARMRAAGRRYAKVGTGLDVGHAPARRAYEKAGFDRAVPAVTYWREL